LVGWDELAPGTNIQDDAGLARVIDEQLASYEHPTSTAPMGGGTDQWAMVDNMGSVRGVTGLRVIDASILPEIPSTATNLTVIMVAEHIYSARGLFGRFPTDKLAKHDKCRSINLSHRSRVVAARQNRRRAAS
jgi:hypothetical protein